MKHYGILYPAYAASFYSAWVYDAMLYWLHHIRLHYVLFCHVLSLSIEMHTLCSNMPL